MLLQYNNSNTSLAITYPPSIDLSLNDVFSTQLLHQLVYYLSNASLSIAYPRSIQ